MTNPTPHGQVPEALIDLIDAYAETRHRCGGIYNAKTEAARKAVIEALSGVQALSAAPAVPAGWKAVPVNPTPEMWKAAKTVPDPNPPYPPHYGLVWDAMLAATPTPPAEQQAAATEGYVQPVPDKCDRITWRGRYYHLPLTEQDAPKAAPQQESTASNESAYQRGYMDGMAKGRRDAETAPQQEAQEPVATLHCNDVGYVWARATEVGKLMRFEQPLNLYTAPQPAPAPLSEMPYEKRKAIQEGEQISASDAWFHARINMLDTFDRRNVFRAGFYRGWDAALAAQGGSK